MNPTTANYDEPWQEALSEYFEAFLSFFFPEVHQLIDWTKIPESLEETILQAKAAAQLALESGDRRIQVELVIPEIALQAQALALDFTSIFDSYSSGLRVIFPDTGAAMLARRDWGETVFQLGDLGSRFIPIENKIKPEDEVFLVVCPSSVEINSVEKLCNLAEDRPVVLLILVLH